MQFCQEQLATSRCSTTRACHRRESLKCQGASAALSLATASFKTMKTFERSNLSWRGVSGGWSPDAWLHPSSVLHLVVGSRGLQTSPKPQFGCIGCSMWSSKHQPLFWWLEQHHSTGQRHLTPLMWTVTVWGTDKTKQVSSPRMCRGTNHWAVLLLVISCIAVMLKEPCRVQT